MTASEPKSVADSANTRRRPRAIDLLLAEYGESHRNGINKAIHWLCVPVIFWCVLALLSQVPFPSALAGVVPLGWATVVAVLGTLYYVALSPRLALGMAVFTALSLWLITVVAKVAPGGLGVWQVAVGLFVLAWIGQFVGHAIEGKRPSFFKDLQFLLIGPAWLMSFLFRRLGVGY